MRFPYSFWLIAVGLFLIMVSYGRDAHGDTEVHSSDRRPINGPLRVHPSNPRYFTDNSGRAVYLTGSHTWNNLVDMGIDDPPKQFDFQFYLDWLERYDHNFFRLWAWELVKWDTRGNREKKARMHYVAPQPWQRRGPGTAHDGKHRFDLKKFNDDYFKRLRKRVKAAHDRGIYAAIMLFEGWALQHAPKAWLSHPFHPDNNHQRFKVDLNGDGFGLEVHGGRIPEVNEIQKAYVRKVIDTVNDLDNVLYEISNENHPGSTHWHYDMIRFIKSYELSKPKQHPVGMTFQYKGGKNSTLFNSPADWISPNHQGGYRDNPPASSGSKVILTDTDHLWGIGGNRAWVWKSFLRGLNPIFMDCYKTKVLKKSHDPRWVEPLRKSMGYTLALSRRLDLASLTPQNDLASSKYCLANIGIEYLIYLPFGEKVTVELSSVPGTFTVEWINPVNGKRSIAPKIEGGARRTLSPPFKGDAVLYLKRTLKH